MPAKTAAPGVAALRSPRNSSDGLATSPRPAAGHLEDADLVGRAEAVLDGAEDAEVMAALALEIEHRVDHVLDDARAGDLAVLGDVADEDHRGAGLLGVADQRLRRGAHLGDGAGRRVGDVGPQRLDRIDDDERRRPAVGERGEDVLDAGLGGEQHRRVGEPEPLGAEPDLGDRLLAGDVDDPVPLLRQRAGGLQEQRRLADARVAADEQRRAAHDAAAGHPVELADAGRDPRGLGALAGERRKRNDPALPGAPHRPGGDTGRRRLLDQGVPLAAVVALPLPARTDRAAVLADEGRLEPCGHHTVSRAPDLDVLFMFSRESGQDQKARDR